MDTKTYNAYLFPIAGVQFHQYKSALELNISAGAELSLVLEPENQYDDKAVAIYWEGIMLGYVPKKEAELKDKLYEVSIEDKVRCVLTEVNEEETSYRMFKCIVEVEN